MVSLLHNHHKSIGSLGIAALQVMGRKVTSELGIARPICINILVSLQAAEAKPRRYCFLKRDKHKANIKAKRVVLGRTAQGV